MYKTMEIEFYKYETKCISIIWNNKIQPYGYFYNAIDAKNFIIELINGTTEKLTDYKLQTKNGLINLD
jgi:hypothetical protein